MLRLVAAVCARSEAPGAEETLTLYRRWLETRDPVAERQLQALGITLAGSEQRH
jgi:hypothetical protein